MIVLVITFSPISVVSPAGNMAMSGCKAQACNTLLYLKQNFIQYLFSKTKFMVNGQVLATLPFYDCQVYTNHCIINSFFFFSIWDQVEFSTTL